MRRIDRLVIIAGPTAAGKSTFIKQLTARPPPEIRARYGLEDLPDWPQMVANRLVQLDELELERLILHYDFLWAPGGARAPALLDGAREITLMTLWTPAARLERQLIDGKLRAPFPASPAQRIKAAVFRLLPRPIVRRLAAALPLERLGRWLPERPLIHHLRLIRIYARADGVLALYRGWLEYCDRDIARAREHIIVEFDRELKFYSREEWENRVKEAAGA